MLPELTEGYVIIDNITSEYLHTYDEDDIESCEWAYQYLDDKCQVFDAPYLFSTYFEAEEAVLLLEKQFLNIDEDSDIDFDIQYVVFAMNIYIKSDDDDKDEE